MIKVRLSGILVEVLTVQHAIALCSKFHLTKDAVYFFGAYSKHLQEEFEEVRRYLCLA